MPTGGHVFQPIIIIFFFFFGRGSPIFVQQFFTIRFLKFLLWVVMATRILHGMEIF